MQLQDLQATRFRESLFFAASQNTQDKSIFIWDLYKKRPTKAVDDKVADVPEGVLNFKNEGVEVLAFAWQPNSANLHSLAYLPSKKETFLCSNNVSLVERKFATVHEKEDLKNGGGKEEKFSVQINFLKPDKHTTFERLPVDIIAFQIDEKQRSLVFGMDRNNHVMMDLRDKSNVKILGRCDGERSEGKASDLGTYHVAYNGQNDVIFAKTGRILKFDIRKVA